LTGVFDTEVDGVKFAIKALIIFLTVSSILIIKMFASNFDKTITFEKFGVQLTTVILLQGLLNLLEAILTMIGPEIQDHTERESINLLFIGIYSIIVMLFSVFQKISFRAKSIYDNSIKAENIVHISRTSLVDG